MTIILRDVVYYVSRKQEGLNGHCDWLLPLRYLGYLVSIIGHPFRVRNNLQNLLQVFFIYLFITKLTKNEFIFNLEQLPQDR